MTTDQLYKLSLSQDIAQNLATSGIPPAEVPADVAALLERAANLAAGSSRTTTQAVRSIFSSLIIDGEIAPAHQFFPVQPLTLDRNSFPTGKPSQPADIHSAFQADFRKITGNDRASAETLLHVLHKYASALPTKERGDDVSLYDFAKSKAGIAVCLWRATHDEKLPGEIRDESAPIMLLGGGISGIQKFLYDIIGTNASKNLKGRSYYLHLLADSVVRHLMRGLELYQGNVVTASGGRFHLLAPNTQSVKDKLLELKKEISNSIFEKYATRLSLELDWVPISLTVLERAKIGSVFEKLDNKIAESKYRRHQDQIFSPASKNGSQTSGYDFFFKPSEIGGERARDTVTGEELSDEEMKEAYIIQDALPKKANKREKELGENLTAPDTAQQIFLGKSLRNCHTRFVSHGQQLAGIGLDDLSTEEIFNPGGLSEFHYIIDEGALSKSGQLGVDFLSINDLDKFSKQIGKISNNPEATYGFELYGGNKFPSIKVKDRKGNKLDLVKTFSELAGLSDEEFPNREYVEPEKFPDIKFKRLAILRMDVDNLGHIFKTAFGDMGTFARYYALSRQLDWFFKGYLNTLWGNGMTTSPTGETYAWKEYVQITYAGGDDLFVVGKWDCVIDFALKIREEFKAWTCGHLGLDISGSVTIVTPKFPVYAAARQGGKDEKKAKNHFYPMLDELPEEERTKIDRIEKQSFTLFGLPLNWQHEFPLVLKLRDELKKYVENMPAKALIQQIQNFEVLRDHQRKYGLTETWRWQLAYQITRSIERYNLKSEDFFTELPLGVFCNQCKFTKESNWKHDKHSSRDFLTFLSLAARWVEFEYRKDKKTR